jgi:hypothetical protein
MKATYSSPAVVAKGDVVRETRAPFVGPESQSGNLEAVGSVGFHL